MSSFPSDPNRIKNWYVYAYRHLDDLSMIRSIDDVMEDIGKYLAAQGLVDDDFEDQETPADYVSSYRARLIEAAKSRLLEAGWKGDGEGSGDTLTDGSNRIYQIMN